MKKGQTALEYLMTYGWAILIVIVVVAALYALGLTKPCRWTGTQIREFADFKVDNPKYDFTTRTISFDISYLKPQTVKLDGVSVTGDASGVTIDPTSQLQVGDEITSTPKRLVLSGTLTKSSGDCYSLEITLIYRVQVAGGEETFSTVGKISGVAS